MLKTDPILQDYVKSSKLTISKLYRELIKNDSNEQIKFEINNLTRFVDEFEVKNA